MLEPKRARQCWNIDLLDLPEGLLSSILKHLSIKSKCQSQLVCRTFRDVLHNPCPGSFVWDTVQLEDPVFEAASSTAMIWQVRCIMQIQDYHASVLYRAILSQFSFNTHTSAYGPLHKPQKKELDPLNMQVAHSARTWHQVTAVLTRKSLSVSSSRSCNTQFAEDA